MKSINSKEDFANEIKSGKSIALFSADWCPDCVVIKPLLPELTEKYRDYNFVYVDRDEHMDICQEYDIFGIPSFIAFVDGEVVGTFISKDRKTKEEIESFIESV
jgi:thiol-disulfide isomerase/thioredoxin